MTIKKVRMSTQKGIKRSATRSWTGGALKQRCFLSHLASSKLERLRSAFFCLSFPLMSRWKSSRTWDVYGNLTIYKTPISVSTWTRWCHCICHWVKANLIYRVTSSWGTASQNRSLTALVFMSSTLIFNLPTSLPPTSFLCHFGLQA